VHVLLLMLCVCVSGGTICFIGIECVRVCGPVRVNGTLTEDPPSHVSGRVRPRPAVHMYVCGLVWRQEIADMPVALWAEIFSAVDFGMSSESPTWGRTGGDLADAGIE
jgi:hypothetical protein